MLVRLGCIGLIFFAWEVSGHAHPIPTLIVETVFEQNGEYELKVNLDPRLFLHPVPSTLPPVPGSWWMEQDADSQAKSKKEAVNYLGKTLQFMQNASSTPMSIYWDIQAVDSVLVTPLAPTSAEVHLLAQHRGKLPGQGGEFRVSLDKSSAVPLIVINRLGATGRPEPQSVYPGESSRAFALPMPAVAASAVTNAGQDSKGEAPGPHQPATDRVSWRLGAVAAMALALVATAIWQRRSRHVDRR